jgi:hypothetical protein
LASPQDYLEKIFQVPFNLQRLERRGFEELAGKLFTTPTQAPANLPASTGRHRDAVPPVSILASTEAPEKATDSGKLSATSIAPASTEIPTLAAGHEQPPLPERLHLEEWELAAVKLCHSLFRTPRAVKRFANTYCLIRVGVEPNDWEAFLGSSQNPGSHRTPLLMLAVSAAFPTISRHWLAALEDGTIKSWTPREDEIPALVGDHSNAQATAEWNELCRGLEQMDADNFAQANWTVPLWIRKVERYSF